MGGQLTGLGVTLKTDAPHFNPDCREKIFGRYQANLQHNCRENNCWRSCSRADAGAGSVVQWHKTVGEGLSDSA